MAVFSAAFQLPVLMPALVDSVAHGRTVRNDDAHPEPVLVFHRSHNLRQALFAPSALDFDVLELALLLGRRLVVLANPDFQTAGSVQGRPLRERTQAHRQPAARCVLLVAAPHGLHAAAGVVFDDGLDLALGRLGLYFSAASEGRGRLGHGATLSLNGHSLDGRLMGPGCLVLANHPGLYFRADDARGGAIFFGALAPRRPAIRALRQHQGRESARRHYCDKKCKGERSAFHATDTHLGANEFQEFRRRGGCGGLGPSSTKLRGPS